MIRVETNLLDYFKRSSELRRNWKYVEARLSGVGPWTLPEGRQDDASRPGQPGCHRPSAAHAESLPGVDKTMSFVDFLKE
jgi:hypothetical protein